MSFCEIILGICILLNGFPQSLTSKESACQCRRCGLSPGVRKIPWRRKWQSTPVFLLGNPMDREAWWATVHGSQRVRHDLTTKQQQQHPLKQDAKTLTMKGKNDKFDYIQYFCSSRDNMSKMTTHKNGKRCNNNIPGK